MLTVNRRRCAGYSLVEVVIAALILLVVALAIVPLFTRSIVQNVSGADALTLTSYSRSEAETLFQVPFNADLVSPPVGTKERLLRAYWSLDEKKWIDLGPSEDPPSGTLSGCARREPTSSASMRSTPTRATTSWRTASAWTAARPWPPSTSKRSRSRSRLPARGGRWGPAARCWCRCCGRTRRVNAVARLRREHRPGTGEGGFSFIEVTVALAITVVLIIAALGMFDLSNRVTRAQIHIAEMQQSLRAGQIELVRNIRMTGRGGLHPNVGSAAAADTIQLTALSVRDNVPDDASALIAPGYEDSPKIAPGTDVLALRGVFSNAIFQVDSVQPDHIEMRDVGGVLTDDPTMAETGRIQICQVTSTGLAQDLGPIADAVGDADHPGRPEALLLTSPLDDSIYAVVELAPETSTQEGLTFCSGGVGWWVGFKTTGAVAALYRQLASDTGTPLPSALTSVTSVAILEEYRYYVRKVPAIPGDDTGPVSLRLSRARVYPNTDVAWGNQVSSLAVDIADDIIDFQVALALDVNNDGVITDTGDADDEWLFNAGGGDADDPTEAGWLTVPGSLPARRTHLYYARVSTLARTSRAEPYYLAPLIETIEDHVYDSASDANSEDSRRHHRRLLQTVVDMRNI